MSDLIAKSQAEHGKWHRRWNSNDIAFHEADGNHLLKKHFDMLAVAPEQTIFLPLCGKTKDIAWLLDKGLRVVGIELNESAIQQLFEELGIDPSVETAGEFTIYRALHLTIFVGDFFALSSAMLGQVNAIYDRAALVALPLALRKEYTRHLAAITANAKQLLVCFDYDQALFSGPPFSVTKKEVLLHYNEIYRIESPYRQAVEGGFRGEKEVYESVYLLTKAIER